MSDYDSIAPFYDIEHAQFDEDLDMYRNFAELSGGKILELACGSGRLLLPLARDGFQVMGVDTSVAMLKLAEHALAEAGVGGRTQFEVASATGYTGRFDLICFFDCLHDMGDPVGAARHAREHLAPGGTVLLVEPFALDGRPRNIAENPMAAMMYVASASICTPNSLSQEVGLALGAQAGEARLRKVFEDAGFTHFRRAAQTPMNLILEARA